MQWDRGSSSSPSPFFAFALPWCALLGRSPRGQGDARRGSAASCHTGLSPSTCGPSHRREGLCDCVYTRPFVAEMRSSHVCWCRQCSRSWHHASFVLEHTLMTRSPPGRVGRWPVMVFPSELPVGEDVLWLPAVPASCLPQADRAAAGAADDGDPAPRQPGPQRGEEPLP